MNKFIKIYNKIYNKIFNISKNNKKVKKLYTTPDDLSKITKKIFEPIPELKIPNNNKPNILIMDDDYNSVEYIKRDLLELSIIGKKLRSKVDRKLYKTSEKLLLDESTPLQLKQIENIDISKYNIISAKGNMAAFSVVEAIKNGSLKNVKVAILDIILGGYKIENNKNIIYDGIDIAKDIWNTFSNSKILFYTGCTIGKHSEEAKKFRDMFPNRDNIFTYTVFKDLNINFLKFKLLDLFCDLSEI